MEKVKNLNKETKQQIFKMMATPGVAIEDIAEKFNLEYEDLMKFLEKEYMKHNLDYGRRLCCRF